MTPAMIDAKTVQLHPWLVKTLSDKVDEDVQGEERKLGVVDTQQ